MKRKALIVLIILLNLFLLKFNLVIVSGNSMNPTLTNHQVCIMMKTKQINDGDIIVINTKNIAKIPAKSIIKRYNADYSTPQMIYVEGDNKNNSLDSHDFGLINRHNIKGKIIFVSNVSLTFGH